MKYLKTRIFAFGLLSIILLSTVVFSQTYSTDFDSTENPISEGGNWLNGKANGTDWADIATYSGVAHGTNTTVQYSDPTAVLKGSWSADQTVMATVYSVNQTSSYYQEVELRLRSAITAHSCSGYEIFFRCLKTSAAYTQIVKWNGPVASFSYLADKGGAEYGVANGDVVKATIVGNTITAYINNVQKAQVTDNTFLTGNPGIGFNYGCNGTYGDFGFTSFSAIGSGTGNSSQFDRKSSLSIFSLIQNAANGSSPGTTLKYSLSWAGKVSLKVFDMLGHEKASLVHGNQTAGAHSIYLDGYNLPAGAYIIRLSSNGVAEGCRILLPSIR